MLELEPLTDGRLTCSELGCSSCESNWTGDTREGD